MRTMSLRALWRDPPPGESVMVTRDHEVIGTYVPVAVELPEALEAVHEAPKRAAASQAAMTQADRDAVLRRISGGAPSPSRRTPASGSKPSPTRGG